MMKHFFALPALLRPALLLAAASQNSFSVNDDLLAFPQYEVKFVDEFVTEDQAHSKLRQRQNTELNLNGDNEGQQQQADSDALGRYHPPSTHTPTADGDGQSKPSPSHPLVYETLLLHGQPHLCSVPQIPAATLSSSASSTAQNDTLTRAEQAKELARATDRGWELVQGMQGNCVYFVSGWWSYRFCYGEGIKQFHQLPPSRGVPVYPPVEDPSVDGFWLGTYEGVTAEEGSKGGKEDDEEQEQESGLDVSNGKDSKQRAKKLSVGGELVQRGESRYLVQRLGGGTTCDLTGKERKAEVQFHCNPQSTDRISLIKETSTCAYLLVVQTPRLCSDVAFLPPQKDAPNNIACSPILRDDEIDVYERELAALQSAEEKAAAAAKTLAATPDSQRLLGDATKEYAKPLQIVGDIAVGGHAFVPLGKKIEKTAIVGGGKETYIDTLASSDGRVLSEEEIKKLGLGDPKAVAKLRKDLEKIAKGQQWKLDVIDTPRGREYRGIIGDEEDQEGKKDGSGKGKDEDGDNDEREEGEGSQEEFFKEEL